MSKKLFVFLVTAVVCFTGFLAYKRVSSAGDDENPTSSFYNPEEYFERVMAEDQMNNPPEGGDSAPFFTPESTGGEKQKTITVSGAGLKK